MMTESTLTPQAPLDLGRLESEAKIAATKYVSNLLQVSLNFATTVKHIYIYINETFAIQLNAILAIKYNRYIDVIFPSKTRQTL